MSVLKFRPQLESMDERIVPDAAPYALPVPDPAAEAAPAAEPAPAPAPHPEDLTDATCTCAPPAGEDIALMDFLIAQKEAQIKTMEDQLQALGQFKAGLQKDMTAAFNAQIAAGKVVTDAMKALADIAADPQRGSGSAEYFTQKIVVEQARRAAAEARGKVLGLEIAVNRAEAMIKDLEERLSNAKDDLESMRRQRNGTASACVDTSPLMLAGCDTSA